MRQIFIFTFFLLIIGDVNVCNAQQGTYALKFDGSNDYVRFPNNANFQPTGGALTCEAWINVSDLGGNDQKILLNLQWGPARGYSMNVYKDATGYYFASSVYLSGTSFWSSNSSYLPTNQWVHIAMTWQQNGMLTSYLNGKKFSETPTTGAYSATSLATDLGSGNGSWAFFKGYIDEVRIWNTVRTEAEINTNMYKEIATHANLKAYYKMSNGSGTSLTDDSGNSNNASINNGPEWKASGCFGGSRQALNFDGIDDYVDCGSTATTRITNNMTITAWAKPTVSSGWRDILTNQWSFGTSGTIIAINGATGQLHYAITGNGGTVITRDPSAFLLDGEWHHIAITFQSGVIKTYFDGKLIDTYNSSISSIIYAGAKKFYIGKDSGTEVEQWKGKIDEVTIWDKVLSESEISDMLAKTLVGNEIGLKAYYRMDQYDGTTLYDNTSNGNNGTLTNMNASAWVASDAFNTWIGAESSSWTNGLNWTNGVPASTQSIGIYSWNLGNTQLYTGTNTFNIFYLKTGQELTINQGATLILNGNLVNDGIINIKSNASGDGSLITKETISGNGTYTVDRYLAASKWHLVSSPITNGLSGVFEDIWLRGYNESTNTFGAYITPTTTPMPTGKGFSVWTNTTNEIRTFSGTINNGTITPAVQLTGAASANTGWNLIGNPYPSAIDWNAASGWTKTNIANSVYVWNNNQYATYVNGIGTNGGSRYIAMEQGFFVQATGAGANISLNNNVRVQNSVGYMKTNDEEPTNIIRIKVYKGSNSDETVIAIRDNGSDIFNPETDAMKLPGNSSSPQMHTVKSDNYSLAISTLTSTEEVVGKYVYLDITETGLHQLMYTHTLTETYIPRLFDTKTQIVVEPNTLYSFKATIGDTNTRFQFIESLPMAIENSEKESQISAWVFDNKLYIANPTNEEIKQIELFSMDGKLVSQGKAKTIDLSKLSKAIYLVRVTTSKQTITKKISIK